MAGFADKHVSIVCQLSERSSRSNDCCCGMLTGRLWPIVRIRYSNRKQPFKVPSESVQRPARRLLYRDPWSDRQ